MTVISNSKIIIMRGRAETKSHTIIKSNQILKRNMWNSVKQSMSLIKNTTSFGGGPRGMSVLKSVRLTGKAKQYANDGTGKHTHVMKERCTLSDCEQKKCQSLCASEGEADILGHNTHKPPSGRFTKFIAAEDANGDPKTQYFVKTNKKCRLTVQEKQQQSKDIKADKKQDNFIKKYNDKYED